MKYGLLLMLVLCGAGLAQVCAPIGVLQPNAQVSATLGVSNCTLSDGTWYADYPVVFSAPGAWSGSVTVAAGASPLTLILRDSSGAQIGSGASLHLNVERGAYHVLVNAAAPNQGGSYQLTSSFTAAPNVLCWNFALMGTIRPVVGSLGTGSCTLPDGTVYDGYQLTLYGAGTVDIAVTAGFTPLLILRTSDGYALPGVVSTDASGATHLTVAAVGDDTYTLVVAVSSPGQAGGAYSASAKFTPYQGETCVSQAALTATQQSTGSISQSSCNFNLPGRDDDALFNFYNIHLSQTGVIQASIASVDFSSLLLLLDADGNSIGEDIESGSNGAPLLQQQLQPGDYQLIVFNEDSFGGNYTLNYQYTAAPAAACPVTVISPGNQVSGTLTGGVSCNDFGVLADAYQVVLPAAGTLTLTLSSPAFTTFLDLHDAKDNDLTWGAQSANGAFITTNLPAGTYYAYAASLDLTGGYSLSYTFTPLAQPACPAAMSMAPNQYIMNAQVGSASCLGTDGRLADFYTFTLPAASTEAVIMLSNFLPPDVTLYRSDGTPLRTDQDSYAYYNSIIVQSLPAGTYLLKARSADPNTEGYYSLYLEFQPGASPQLCAPLSLPAAGSVSATTSFASCAWYDKTFADVYRLSVTGSTQSLAIGAQSNTLDTALVLMDAKGNVLATDNNNSAGGLNSLISQTLAPGVYFVAVKPLSDPTSTGSYVLTTVSSPPPAAPAVGPS